MLVLPPADTPSCALASVRTALLRVHGEHSVIGQRFIGMSVYVKWLQFGELRETSDEKLLAEAGEKKKHVPLQMIIKLNLK